MAGTATKLVFTTQPVERDERHGVQHPARRQGRGRLRRRRDHEHRAGHPRGRDRLRHARVHDEPRERPRAASRPSRAARSPSGPRAPSPSAATSTGLTTADELGVHRRGYRDAARRHHPARQRDERHGVQLPARRQGRGRSGDVVTTSTARSPSPSRRGSGTLACTTTPSPPSRAWRRSPAARSRSGPRAAFTLSATSTRPDAGDERELHRRGRGDPARLHDAAVERDERHRRSRAQPVVRSRTARGDVVTLERGVGHPRGRRRGPARSRARPTPSPPSRGWRRSPGAR